MKLDPMPAPPKGSPQPFSIPELLQKLRGQQPTQVAPAPRPEPMPEPRSVLKR